MRLSTLLLSIISTCMLCAVSIAQSNDSVVENKATTSKATTSKATTSKAATSKVSTNSAATNSIATHNAVTKDGIMRLEVIDPFVEMHTGPGRGYPVFHVIEQGEIVQVLTRRPDWYEIRSQNGKIGWTTAVQLSRTLQPTGVPVDLPTVSHGDYLKDSWRIGFTAGRFVNSDDLEGADNFSVTAGYRPLQWLGAEIEGGRTYSNDISGDYYGINLIVEPFSQWQWSPYVMAGKGNMTLESQPKLVPLGVDKSDYNSYGIGMSYYLGRNFMIRGEYRWYSVSADDNDTVELQEWKLGFSTFF